MAELNASQIRYKKLFENHVDVRTNNIFDKEFERDVLSLRADERMASSAYDDEGREIEPSRLEKFLIKYDFPDAMSGFIYEYIKNDVIDFRRIRSGMYLVSEADDTGAGYDVSPEENFHFYIQDKYDKPNYELKLVISPYATINELRDFITVNQEFIRNKQKLYKHTEEVSGVIRQQYNAKRDYRIMELLETHKPKEVAIMISKEYPGYAPTPMDISKIKHRLKYKNITL